MNYEFAKWDESLSVGIAEMDEHHKHFFELIKILHDAMESGQGKEVIVEIVGKLYDYTIYHFEAEEKYMEQVNSIHLDDQRRQHQAFIKEVESFKEQVLADKINLLSVKTAVFMNHWLAKHIRGEDQKYTEELKQLL